MSTPLTLPPSASIRRAQELGDDLPVAWKHRDERYSEKLATPDTSVGDLIGDVDPMKVAEGRSLGDPETIHYGLVPRAHRGIVAINELPDLAERIQVAMLNVMEERDIQVRGYTLRLPLDVLLFLALTVLVDLTVAIGVGVAVLVVTVTFPVPSVFDSNVLWITFAVAPAYIVLAFMVGVIWATNRVIRNVRWAIEEREPTRADQRNTFVAPWRLTRVLLVLWAGGTTLLTLLYGLQNAAFIPKVLLGISFPGIVVSASCYLFTEFALRPVAAQALEVGPPPRRFAPGIMGRTLTVWALGSGVPVLGILLSAIITLTLQIVSPTQFAIAVMILRRRAPDAKLPQSCPPSPAHANGASACAAKNERRSAFHVGRFIVPSSRQRPGGKT